jgi:molybdopterin-guanine dinucleotide biosynthesis protein A
MDETVAAVILAGGQSRRMGGVDKALLPLDGKPLIAHVAGKLANQAALVAINANGDPGRFLSLGLPVFPDLSQPGRGPLEGIVSALHWTKTHLPNARYIATAACDTPFFPSDLIAALRTGLRHPDDVAVAMHNGRLHPAFALWPLSRADQVSRLLSDGILRMHDVMRELDSQPVEFASGVGGIDASEPFFNVNTPADLAQAEAYLASKRGTV